jgi:hypothetical protein
MHADPRGLVCRRSDDHVGDEVAFACIGPIAVARRSFTCCIAGRELCPRHEQRGIRVGIAREHVHAIRA